MSTSALCIVVLQEPGWSGSCLQSVCSGLAGHWLVRYVRQGTQRVLGASAGCIQLLAMQVADWVHTLPLTAQRLQALTNSSMFLPACMHACLRAGVGGWV